MSILGIILLVLVIYLFITGRFLMGLLALIVLLLASCSTVKYQSCDTRDGVVICSAAQKMELPSLE